MSAIQKDREMRDAASGGCGMPLDLYASRAWQRQPLYDALVDAVRAYFDTDRYDSRGMASALAALDRLSPPNIDSPRS